MISAYLYTIYLRFNKEYIIILNLCQIRIIFIIFYYYFNGTFNSIIHLYTLYFSLYLYIYRHQSTSQLDAKIQ